MTVTLEPGDVFLTRGKGWLSKAIRFFSRSIGESRTKVNHVGLVVAQGDLEHCVVVEALSRVRRHTLWIQYGPTQDTEVAVYRPTNLTAEQLVTIVAEANEQVNKTYGYLKIAGHLLDWCLGGAYVFRRVFRNGKYPICSWLVAHAYARVGKTFGVDPGAANPDDIWDFVTSRPDKYRQVHPLQKIWT